MKPSLYAVEVRHLRAEPVRHEVRHRSYLWFVDVDALPDFGLLARFPARDHAGDPRSTLRQNLDSYLAAHGVELDGGPITMLANARSFGYVFNPLTLYWCHNRAGELRCVIAEVHNTYRQRHRYLLDTDDAGRSTTAKTFYVSPFHPVEGQYRLTVPEPGDGLDVTITLHRADERPFVATVRGTRRLVTRRAVLALAMRHPLETWLIRLLITAHGVALWRTGLRRFARP